MARPSDDEMSSGQSGDEGMEMEETEETAKETTKETSKKTSHPPYIKMLVEAISEQQTTGRQTAISKDKIIKHMKTKYGLDEVNANAFKKAVKAAEESELIEHKTGTGVSGSFILTKKERALQTKKSSSKLAEKPSKPAEKSTTEKAETKPRPKAVKVKDTKQQKPPLPKPAKGKENKDTKEKPKKDGGPAVKKPTLSKSRSASAVMNVVDDAVPSTSKARKPPAAKKAKAAK